MSLRVFAYFLKCAKNVVPGWDSPFSLPNLLVDLFMKKQPTKKQKLITFVKQHSSFYAYEDFNFYTIKQLETIKREIKGRLEKPPIKKEEGNPSLPGFIT